jgi:hypothetical protein
MARVTGDAIRSLRYTAPRETAAAVAVEFTRGLSGKRYSSNDLWWVDALQTKGLRKVIVFWRRMTPHTMKIVEQLCAEGYEVAVLGRQPRRIRNTVTAGFPPIDWVDTARRLVSLTFRRLTADGSARSWEYPQAVRTLCYTAMWRAFMREQHIVAISTSVEARDPVSLAADCESAVHIGWHWSSLSPGYPSVQPLHQAYFTWSGAYSEALRCNPGKVPGLVLESGCVHERWSLEAARGLLGSRGIDTSKQDQWVCVFDRSLSSFSNYGLEEHREFFEAILDWIDERPRTGLLFKLKDRGDPRIFAMCPSIGRRIAALEREGRAVRMDGTVPAQVGAVSSSASVALGYNSAGVLASLANREVLFWDPAGLSDSVWKDWFASIGYESDRNAFDTMTHLLSRLDTLLTQERREEPSTALEVLQLDSYHDERAAQRIARFVDGFIENCESGLDQRAALVATADEYRHEFVPRPAQAWTPGLFTVKKLRNPGQIRWRLETISRPGEAAWSFGSDIADVFVERAEQSIPMYHEGHDLICEVSDFFVRPESRCYEVGVSTVVSKTLTWLPATLCFMS